MEFVFCAEEARSGGTQKTVTPVGLAFTLAAALLLASCGSSGPDDEPSGARGTRLTPTEVREVFVGRPWQGATGVYEFGSDGTYTYRSTETTMEWGPFPYTIEPDGRITSPSATLTFYRIGTAYRYHNSDTDEFYLALPIRQ